MIDNSSESPAAFNNRTILLLVGIFLIAVAFRSWNVTKQPYSNDEVIELEDIRLSYRYNIFAADSFPPGFRLLLAPVVRCTDANVAGRWLSVVLGLICVPLGYYCGSLVGGTRTGLIVALFIALSPICVYYAQEVRPYALFMLLGLSTVTFGLSAIESNATKQWTMFAICSILGCYVHYYASLLTFAVLCAWLLANRGFANSRRAMMAILGITVGCLPALYLLKTDFAFTEDHATIEVSADLLALGYSYFCFLSGFTVGPSIQELHELLANPMTAVRAFAPAIAISAVLLAAPMFFGAWKLRNRPHHFWPLVLSAGLPVLLVAILSNALDLNFNVRYVVICAIPCLVLSSVGLASLRSKKLAWVLIAMVSVWFVNANIRRHSITTYHNEDVRSAAEFISQENAEQRDVYVVSDYMARTLRFYSDGTVIHKFPSPDVVMAVIETQEGLQTALNNVGSKNADGCWIVVTRAYHADPHRLFRDWLAGNNDVEWMASFTGIEIYFWTPSS